jgi:hypothetical protein
MTTTTRRLAATLALPVALLLTASACGDDEPAADTSSQSAAESDPATDGVPEASVPAAGDIPDPAEDPEGFRAYVEQMYVDAGMSEAQASCMADAFTDNVDLSKVRDPDAVAEMMGDQGLQDAMMECM